VWNDNISNNNENNVMKEIMWIMCNDNENDNEK